MLLWKIKFAINIQKINHKCYWFKDTVFFFVVRYLLRTLSAFSLANLTFSSKVLALVAEETYPRSGIDYLRTNAALGVKGEGI